MYNFRPNTLFVGQKIIYLPSCQSTNDEAADLIQQGQAVEGTVVITSCQTAGRGQRGNRWEAQAGQNLTFSLIFQPHFLQANEQFWLNMAVSLGICDWLEPYLNDRMRIKWPNDLYVDTRKIGGILIENTLQGYSLAWSVVGIGLNINQTRFFYSNATSLVNELPDGQGFVLEKLLSALLTCLERRYLALRTAGRSILKAAYLQRLFRYQEEHRFLAENEYLNGVIVGVDEAGRLALQTGGQLRYFGFKEIEFLI